MPVLSEGQNVAVEYHSPGGENEHLRAVVAELLDRQVAVIVGNTLPALAAKMATSTVPLVFFTGTDPVKLGLVASFNRPGGNATGVSFLASDLDAKRLGLLRELVPRATVIGALDQCKPVAICARSGPRASPNNSCCAGEHRSRT
jgi:putative ABC transport system substrate-binding protein